MSQNNIIIYDESGSPVGTVATKTERPPREKNRKHTTVTALELVLLIGVSLLGRLLHK